MRASRLLTILMVLQARGRVTARELADECEVSIRTVYRDVDALSAAGVPVYADRGSAGGYRLLDGYRTRLNGVSPQEAQAMFLSGLTGPADALGLGSALGSARLKLVTALPPSMRSAADHVRARFHLDVPAWFHRADAPEHLRELFTAVWDDRYVEIRYRSWKAEKRRRVAPLGLVLKGGAWYLVGAVEGSVRTYHVGRVRELTVLVETFEREASFDLSAHWAASTDRLEEELHPNRAVVRLSPTGMKMIVAILSPYVRSRLRAADPDPDGYIRMTLPVGSAWHAVSELLRFGTELEVLEPAELRSRMADTVAALNSMYATASPGCGVGEPEARGAG